MNITNIDIEILESTPNQVKVKLPFVDIPVKMNHRFFNRRVENGYFNILNENNENQYFVTVE